MKYGRACLLYSLVLILAGFGCHLVVGDSPLTDLMAVIGTLGVVVGGLLFLAGLFGRAWRG